MKDYISLHNHTSFSFLNSLISPKELFERAKELNQSSIAITDFCSMAGMWDGLKYSKTTGVKLIAGNELCFTDDIQNPSNRLRSIVLLAKNHQGYKNLLKLQSKGFENNIILFKKSIPRIDWKLLEKYSEGLICLTGGGGGIISQLLNTKRMDEAKETTKRLKGIFGDFLGLEIQPNSLRSVSNLYRDYEDQTFTNRQLIKFGKEFDIKVVIATDAHFVKKEQFLANDCELAIGAGQPIVSNNRLKYTEDFYMKSRQEIVDFFSRTYPINDVEEYCDNSLLFASMCEVPNWIDPKFSNIAGRELPDFPVKDQIDYNDFIEWKNKQDINTSWMSKEDSAYLRYVCFNNLSLVPQDNLNKYIEGLEEELEVFDIQDFSGYMLIVADFLIWARKKGIRTGIGRGSVGGSLVAFLLGIHLADPIKYNLVFARFQNKERPSPPDIDCDVEPSGRARVYTYLENKYGADKIAAVSNIITMTPKVFARDVSRACLFGGTREESVILGTKLADAIPADINSVPEALTKAPLFAEFAKQEKYKQLDFAKDLSNKPRGASTHAAGLVITKRPLNEIIPTRKDRDGNIAIEYEKERAEANGLIKIDVLGLETLAVISDTYKLIKEQGKEAPPDPINFNEYDKETYDLISSGNTLGVFQLGQSAGTIDLCKKIQPKSIEDISVINSLCRPSAKNIREPYVQTRNGEKTFKLLHPKLERAFGGANLGFALYDECLIWLAADIAGWSLSKADILRKITKDKGKHPEKTAEAKKEFIEDAVKNNIERKIAIQIWEDIVEKFGAYGFNISHSTLYSICSYWTAYLKAHFPLEFLTATLKSKIKSNAKKAAGEALKFKNEIRKLKVKVVSPDINASDTTFKIIDKDTLMTGLDSLKYIGKDAIPEILEKRPFSSFEDFLNRTNPSKCKSPAIQALIASGCMDIFGINRKIAYEYSADYRKKLSVWKKKHKEQMEYKWPEGDDWTTQEKHALEVYYLGEGISGNTYQVYKGFFDKNADKFTDYAIQFPDEGDSDAKFSVSNVQGIIIDFFEFNVKKQDSKNFGKPMMKVALEDVHSNTIMLTVFSKQLQEFKKKIKLLTKNDIKVGLALKLNGSLNYYEGELNITYLDLLAVQNPPEVPKDLKAKQIKSSRSKKLKTDDICNLEADDVLEEVGDELIEEGVDVDFYAEETDEYN